MTAFAVVNMDYHALAIDVFHLQAAQLGAPDASGIKSV